MKILYIDMMKYGHNKELHFNAVVNLEKFVTLVTYGPLNGASKSYVETRLEKLKDVIKSESPDCLVTYNLISKNSLQMRYVDNVLKDIDIPKFHISVDYSRDFDDKSLNTENRWFANNNYKAVFFRYKTSMALECPIPKYYLPHSIDPAEWAKYDIDDKENKVCFAGTLNFTRNLCKVYRARIDALKYLREKGLVNNFNFGNRKRLNGSEYKEFIGNHAFGLTCSSKYKFLLAKHFEIPAGGSILITDGLADGIEDFPENSYLCFDHKNMEESTEKILEIMGDDNKRKTFGKRLQRYVYDECSHDARFSYFANKIKLHL